VEYPAKYLGIGVRIEDDVLVTATGHDVLSAAAIKDVATIERVRGEAMAGRSAPAPTRPVSVA